MSAVLLTGGESRRMGQDKATLVFEGKPLWQRQLRLLRELSAQQIFLSARTEQPWRPADIELLVDEPPSRGPISGIAAALARIETSHLLVLAVDMPFLIAGDLLRLVNTAQEDCGVVPASVDWAEPLAAIYPKESRVEFAAALSNSDTSLQPLIMRLFQTGKVQFVELSQADAERYRSVNTPENLVAQQPVG